MSASCSSVTAASTLGEALRSPSGSREFEATADDPQAGRRLTAAAESFNTRNDRRTTLGEGTVPTAVRSTEIRQRHWQRTKWPVERSLRPESSGPPTKLRRQALKRPSAPSAIPQAPVPWQPERQRATRRRSRRQNHEASGTWMSSLLKGIEVTARFLKSSRRHQFRPCGCSPHQGERPRFANLPRNFSDKQ